MNLLRLTKFVVPVVIGLSPAVAWAEDAAVTAAADALFRQGRQLYEEKKYADACPKFAESYRLDPATGSLLALASCHEAQGKLASAWAEYNDTAARARREGQNERAEAAKLRAANLEPRLAKLNIAVAPGTQVPGLQITRDGVALAGGALGAPLPVDRGDHTIEASAPGFEKFSKLVKLVDGASLTVTIPRLAESPKRAEAAAPIPAQLPPVATPAAPAPTPAASELAPQQTVKRDASSGSSVLRPLGIAAIAGGVIAGAVGGYFGVQALSKNADSNADNHCINDACDDLGTQRRRDARSAGNLSTAMFVVGGALVAGGVVLFVVGGPAEAKRTVAATPIVGPSSGGFAFNGSF